MTPTENEMAVIAAAILSPSTIEITSGIVGPSDFADRDLGQAFALLVDLHTAGEPIDDTTVLVDRFRRADLLDRLGGVAGIAVITTHCPNAAHAAAYARTVKSAATRRRLKAIAAELMTRAADGNTDPAETIDWAEAELTRQRTGGCVAAVSLASAMHEAIDDIRRGGVTGLPTGFSQFDDGMGGLYPGELVILAARPSIGKSALGCQVAVHNAEADRPVLFVSLEMTSRDIALRKLAQQLDYEVAALRAGRVVAEDIASASAYAAGLESVPMFIWATQSATMAKIRAAARVQKATTGLSMLVVDYLGLIVSEADDRRKPRWEQVTAVSKALKALAGELQIPVLCLCQLNREAEGVQPTVAHLSDSGSIERDADKVLLLHRESRDATSATLNVEKNRNGPRGVITLGFDPEATQFTDAAEWSP